MRLISRNVDYVFGASLLSCVGNGKNAAQQFAKAECLPLKPLSLISVGARNNARPGCNRQMAATPQSRIRRSGQVGFCGIFKHFSWFEFFSTLNQSRRPPHRYLAQAVGRQYKTIVDKEILMLVV